MTTLRCFVVVDNITRRRTTCDIIAGYSPVLAVSSERCHRWERGH